MASPRMRRAPPLRFAVEVGIEAVLPTRCDAARLRRVGRVVSGVLSRDCARRKDMRNRRHERRQSQKARMEEGEWRMEKGNSASQAHARSFSCGVSGASPAAGESARSGVPDELSAISAGRASGEWRMENGEWRMEKVLAGLR